MQRGVARVTGGEISERIREMGYVACKASRIEPCYYKINDGTGAILRVLIRINHLAPRAGSGRDFDVDSSVQISVFVPESGRVPADHAPPSPADLVAGIAVRDVEYEVLREEFSVYSLSDGTTVSIKAAMGQIDKTKFVTPHGEPIYLTNPLPVTKIRHGGA